MTKKDSTQKDIAKKNSTAGKNAQTQLVKNDPTTNKNAQTQLAKKDSAKDTNPQTQLAKKDSIAARNAQIQLAKIDSAKGMNAQTQPAKKDSAKNAQTQLAKTTEKPVPPPPPTFRDYLPDSVRSTVTERAISQLNAVKIQLDQPAYLYSNLDNDLRVHRIAWHEKLTLSVACLVMFLIGAPLGSIIRKGGIGMPLVFAVVFFVIFFLLNNFGKKFVKEDVLTPIGGMWMATYVLTPIGLFLVYKALHDSQLFNKEFYFRIAKAIRSLFRRRQRETAGAARS
jgi:lipopolysaccharide export LptBFGC system permease protein LptF